MEVNSNYDIANDTPLTILCPFCLAPWTAKMHTDFSYSMGSEWTGIYGEEEIVEIYCSNCHRLIYKKN